MSLSTQLFGRTVKASIAIDNGRATEFIRRRNYTDKSKCYECGETGHLSYACPKNLLGEREPPKKKEKKKKKRAQQPEHVEEDEESEEEGEDPALDSLSQAIAFQGCRGTGAYLQQGERRVAPWTGRQSITPTHRANNPYTPFTSKDNFRETN
ncbi:Zinc finger CCHC-type and RNA-binding motif-containing protein 1 [Goodea atripinnis]|uniref:Zinc finger CCHC-type and RNA-binding motif-containing protein 1 n=1 Tax=Goodea atripinnis TaxID=208336 RepID=A0ABV0P5H9_9TELE